jgi:hypothetical protein
MTRIITINIDRYRMAVGRYEGKILGQIKRKRGGRYSIANCVLSCAMHNRAQGDRSIEEFLKGE